MKFFASCGKGLEYLLADELLALGAAKATATMAGVNVEGAATDAQRAVLWSRLASRVLWPITEFDCPRPIRDAQSKSTRNSRSAYSWLQARIHRAARRDLQLENLLLLI